MSGGYDGIGSYFGPESSNQRTPNLKSCDVMSLKCIGLLDVLAAVGTDVAA